MEILNTGLFVCLFFYVANVSFFLFSFFPTGMGKDFKLQKTGGAPPTIGTDGNAYREKFSMIGEGAVRPVGFFLFEDW